MPARRANHSDAISAASAITIARIDQPPRRSFAAGDLQQGVDRGGDGLRFAGNIGNERYRRAEFAERPRKAHHCTGNDARQRQRQGNGCEDPEAIGPECRRRVLEPAVDRFQRQPDRADHQRKAHDAAGERRAGPAEREDDAEMRFQERADRPTASERNEQQVAGNDGRQHQRQVYDAVQQRFPPELLAGEQPADRDAERQCEQRGDDGDSQRQFDRGPFGRREVEHDGGLPNPTAWP